MEVARLEGAGGRAGDGETLRGQLVVRLRQRVAVYLDAQELDILPACNATPPSLNRVTQSLFENNYLKSLRSGKTVGPCCGCAGVATAITRGRAAAVTIEEDLRRRAAFVVGHKIQNGRDL